MTTFYMLSDSQNEKNRCKKMLPPQHQKMIHILCWYFQVIFLLIKVATGPGWKKFQSRFFENHLRTFPLFGKLKTLHGKTCKYIKKHMLFGFKQRTWMKGGMNLAHSNMYEIHDIQPQLYKNYTSTRVS